MVTNLVTCPNILIASNQLLGKTKSSQLCAPLYFLVFDLM